LRATAQHYLTGRDVDFGQIAEEYGRCVRLPAYSRQLSHHWLDDGCAPTAESDTAEVRLQ